MTGVLVDDIDELGTVTAQLLDEQAWRHDLGDKARERAGGYSWAAAATGVTQVLAAAVAGSRSPDSSKIECRSGFAGEARDVVE